MALTESSTRNRWIDVETPLAPGTLVVESVTGTETLGRMFEYEIFAVSEKADIEFDDVLGQHITLMVELNDDSRRAIDGRIVQMGLVGMRGDMYRYRIIARPWTWLMTRTADSRIFQEKTVPEIIEEVFSDQAEATFELNLTGSYTPREYCVQYRETDFNFVSRLMEEEGIYTFFLHESGKHTLIVCDSPSAHASIGTIPFRANTQQARTGGEYIREWSVTREIVPGKSSLRDYNFETPKTDLTVKNELVRNHGESEHEIFDYPGDYPTPADGEHFVRIRLEEMQAGHDVTVGSGNARLMHCGGLFTLEDFVRTDLNREYLIVSTFIEAKNNAVESSDGGEADFRCSFRLIPSDVPYRSPRTTPRPIVQGPQTAVVTGPPGEEIHVDKYGRIKAQFHWDRLGKKDDQSSCWIRVSQIWAGKNFGWMTVPRIGQEVIVDFLEGDADRPIVTGRVYNADQMPPWTLPDNKTQSGILSRSSAGGGPENANQIRFEDKKGEEQIYLHAERNLDSHVELDDSGFVGQDQMLTVVRDQKNTIKRDRWETIERDQHLTVNRDRNTVVKNNETRTINVDQILKIDGKQSQHIIGNQDVQIDGAQTETVNGNVTQVTKSTRLIDTTADDVRKVGGNQVFNVTGDISYKAAKITLQAGHIDFKVTGGNSVVVESPSGPYQMMVNKLEVMSNTDVNLLAVANINSVSMGNNTTVMGANSSAYVGSASDTMLAAARSVFIGMQSETAIAISMSNFVGLGMENALAAKIETCAGVKAELGSLTTFTPGGGGAGAAAGGPQALTGGWAVAAAIGAGATAGMGIGSALLGAMETRQQYKDAMKQLNDAADAAALQGHTNLANRLRALAGSSPVASGVGNAASGVGNALAGFIGVDGPSVDVGSDQNTGKPTPPGG
ncbi:MAG: type secretion protein Rhs [Panacagrimonas sp.]|jgi:type VI secretion system secreted protein VgrG|nr:type VI secretion system tip protein VgrG [Panacagrimonas sp.]MCC2657639.1 type secretion protein Rhs [Panacagrimonas sp.]